MGLAEITWVEVPIRPVVLVPLGSTEQHGPHLPFGTDAVIAGSVALEAAARVNEVYDSSVVVTPVMPYGASGEHQDFPGTISIGHEALRFFLVELVRSVSTWSSRIIFVNGHGGNAPTLRPVIEQMRNEGHQVSTVMCALESTTDAHAGHDETSVMLFLQPERVDMTAAKPGNTTPLTELLPALMSSGIRPVSDTGVLGDPTSANSIFGKKSFEELVQAVVREVIHG